MCVCVCVCVCVCKQLLVRALRADAGPALKLAVVDALTRACQCSESSHGAIDSTTVRELCHGALILAHDADPAVRGAAAQCVQASILLAVAARQPSKALAGLRSALSRLADSCPVRAPAPPLQPYQQHVSNTLGTPAPQPYQQQLLLPEATVTVADRYLEILGRVSHVMLLYPVRLISSKVLLDSMGEELGLPTWLRLLVAGKGGGGSTVATLRSVDLQRVMAFFAQRSQADMLAAMPRLFAISSAASKVRGDSLGEKQSRGVGCGVLEFVDGLERATEDGGRVVTAGRSMTEEGLMWAVVEASRLLIRSKLRSSFGGPVQTFEALEHMLLEACTRAEMDGHMHERDAVTGGWGGRVKWHKALRMLLLFVGHLEKSVFSAYEASVLLPAASVSSIKFFRANRKVCEDWFGRLRKALTRASVITAAPHCILEHALKRLPELLRAGSKAQAAGAAGKEQSQRIRAEKNALALQVCHALSEVGDADALEGFAVWVKVNAKTLLGSREHKPSWIYALSLQTKGLHEEALEIYLEALGTQRQPQQQQQQQDAASVYPVHHPLHPMNLFQNSPAPPQQVVGSVPGGGESTLGGGLPPETAVFVLKNAAKCCLSLGDWSAWRFLQTQFRELVSLHNEDPADAWRGSLMGLREMFESPVTEAMACVDLGNFKEAQFYLEQVPEPTGREGKSWMECVQLSEQLLMRALLAFRFQQLPRAKAMLLEARRMLNDPLALVRMDLASDLLQAEEPLVLLSAISQLQDCIDGVCPTPLSPTSFLATAPIFKCDPSLHALPLWHKVLRLARVSEDAVGAMPGAALAGRGGQHANVQALRLRVAQIARKQRNLNYAHRLLQEEQADGGYAGSIERNAAQDAVKSTAALRAKMETALLCLVKKQEPLALQVLWDAVEQDSGMKGGEETAAKLLRKVSLLLQDRQLAMWWQGEEAVRAVLTRIRGYSEANQLDEWSIQVGLQPGDVQRFDDGVQGAVGAAELLGGFLLHRCSAVYGQSHASGKAYAEYAAWCYGQGRYHVDALTRMSDGRAIGDRARHVRSGIEVRLCSVLRRAVETSGGRVVLTTETLPGARAVHGDEDGPVLTDAALCDLAGQLVESWLMGDVIKDEGDSDKARERERQAISTCQELVPWAGSHVIESLLIEWRASRHRALHLYRAAVSAYFQYLRMGSSGGKGVGAEGGRGIAENSDQVSAGKGGSGSASGVISEVERKETYDVTATLRLLRLLVKYGESLDDLFLANIDTTPPRPWRKIVPQLFARLGHNEACVRQHVRTLIAHIGADLPDAIIYPTVVGHLENPSSRQLSSILENLRLSCESKCPGLVADVQQVIRELNKCSILREDLVWSMLQDAMHKVSAGLRLMREEAARVLANQTLSPDERVRILREKYDAITRPARVVLEPLRRLFESRSHVTEEGEEEGEASAHDIKFVERFGPSFAAALESIRNPRHVYQAEAACEPMRALMKSLNVYMRHTRLSLQALSPVLAGLADTRIPMPGLSVEEEYGVTSGGGGKNGTVTVARLEEHVQMLMTKTKPKKLTMVGSDGRAYTYLLKGREDLHLDERMMQLLDIVNILLQQDRPSHARGLRARSYAVIPVGPRSGLIQWADGTEPLFGIYKSWQGRQSADGGVRRPSDLFYDKIIPALKEHGITRATSRKEWPHDVLRNVFQQLLQETPRDLVSRQIWCSSASSAELWNKTSTHARSMAVSSMVGYIVGLGDRHLDNILINFTSGEVVHIDWNVSFDKGARLKVPETVPYRMTQTLVAALGPYGVEGPFRNSCEKALRVLRRNKEALLTLLEAFVYDPLVDWTSEKNKDESKGVELHVSLSLFASRVDEMKVALGENLQEGVQALGALEHAMREFLSAALTEAAGAQEAEDTNKLEREVVEEIRRLELKMKEQRPVDPNADSLNQHLQYLETQWHSVQTAVREGLMHVSQTAMKQEAAFSSLRSGRPQTLRESLWALPIPPIAPLSSLGAKQGKGAEGIPIEEQAATAFTHATECGKGLLDALGNYAQAVAELPPDYWRTGRAWQWREALSAALRDPSAVSQLCLHFSCSEERMRAQRTELLAVQSRLEADLVAAQSNARDMHAALLAASDPCEPQLLEGAVSAAHAAWARHADRPSLGHAACALQLCDTMARVLGVSLPESSSTKELALFKAAPEEWSAPSHSELLAMVAQVWGVGPQTSRLLQEMMSSLATNINRCGDIVREMWSVSAAASGNFGTAGGGGKGRGAGKGGGGGGSVGNAGGEEVWAACISALEACIHSINHLEVLGSDPQGSSQMVLSQAIYSQKYPI